MNITGTLNYGKSVTANGSNAGDIRPTRTGGGWDKGLLGLRRVVDVDGVVGKDVERVGERGGEPKEAKQPKVDA